MRSLRSHLLVGSILWTIGLLLAAHVLSVHLAHWYFDGPPHFVMTQTTFRLVSAGIVLLALVAMTFGFFHVRRGLAALDELRRRLAEVRQGAAARLEGGFPSEVVPLVEDLNALLAEREAAVERALAKAGDLAHGLKTPLAVLAQEADRAGREGHPELAEVLAQQVARMSRQIEFHLAHARAAGAAAGRAGRCPLRETASGLVRALTRLHADRGRTVVVEVPPELHFRGRREDLEEMLGNLLDNACTWARGQVELRAEAAGDRLVVTVEDDGPGIAPGLRENVLQRGVRADEAAPGSGLGLAIVRELAELYGGSIELDDSPAGGLRARLVLPAA